MKLTIVHWVLFHRPNKIILDDIGHFARKNPFQSTAADFETVPGFVPKNYAFSPKRQWQGIEISFAHFSDNFSPRSQKMGTAKTTVPHCAHSVPVTVKFFQIFPNETKNDRKICYDYKFLNLQRIDDLLFEASQSMRRKFDPCRGHHKIKGLRTCAVTPFLLGAHFFPAFENPSTLKNDKNIALKIHRSSGGTGVSAIATV